MLDDAMVKILGEIRGHNSTNSIKDGLTLN